MELIDLLKKITIYDSVDGQSNSKFERGSDISNQYLDIPQPMPIYHSEEELDTSEVDVVKLRCMGDYMEYILQNKLEKLQYTTLSHNVFLKTVDKFLPEYTDYDEVVFLKLGEDDKPIPVESCWIKLYKVNTYYTKHLLYTSSGIWSIGLNSFKVSAGPKRSYSSITKPTKKTREDMQVLYKNRFNELIQKSKPKARETRLVHLILNPLGPFFLDVDGAIKKVYGTYVNPSNFDKKKFLTSKLFRNTFMSELSMLLPTLTKAVQKAIPPEQMASYLQQIVEKSIGNESSKESMERLKDVMKIAYEDPMAGKRATVNLISDASFTENKTLPEQTEKTEDEIEQSRQELDYPSSFIMSELPDGIEETIPDESDK